MKFNVFNGLVGNFTHIKVVAFPKDTEPSEFIVVPTLKVVLPIVETESEAAAAIAADFYAEITGDTHGAVKAVSCLGEDSVEGFGRGSRRDGRNNQDGEPGKPHDAMSDVSLRFLIL